MRVNKPFHLLRRQASKSMFSWDHLRFIRTALTSSKSVCTLPGLGDCNFNSQRSKACRIIKRNLQGQSHDTLYLQAVPMTACTHCTSRIRALALLYSWIAHKMIQALGKPDSLGKQVFKNTKTFQTHSSADKDLKTQLKYVHVCVSDRLSLKKCHAFQGGWSFIQQKPRPVAFQRTESFAVQLFTLPEVYKEAAIDIIPPSLHLQTCCW